MSLKGVVSSILLSFIFFVYLPSHAYAKLVNIHAQFDEKTDTIYYKGKTYESKWIYIYIYIYSQ